MTEKVYIGRAQIKAAILQNKLIEAAASIRENTVNAAVLVGGGHCFLCIEFFHL